MFEESSEIEEFSIVLVIVAVVDDGDAILDLLREGDGTIVDENDFSEIAILEDAQVFHVALLLRTADFRAAFPVESMREYLAFRVELFENRIGVHLPRGGQENQLEIVREFFENFNCVRTNRHQALYEYEGEI